MRGRLTTLIWQHDPTIYAPAKYQRACEYEAFIPDTLSGSSLQLDAKVAGVVSEAEGRIRELNDAAHPALAPLARLLLRTESIASSKIEGMQLGVRELARAEARMESGGKASTTALEVLANIAAMELAIQDAATADRFTVENITAIHRRLMENVPNAHTAGEIRTKQNWIGGNDHNPCGADFVPPPPEYVADLLSDLCDAVEDDLLPPLVQAALVHAQFETIHPFEDGNGRTGRALIQVVLRRRGISPAYVPPISVVLATSKGRYIDGLTRFREGAVGEWIEQFATATARAAYLAKGYLRAVEELRERWRAQLTVSTAPKKTAAAWAVIEVLPAHPLITASVATVATGRSKAPIYEAIKELEGAGVLVPLSHGRRNQFWEAVGLLDLLAGLEAGQIPAQPDSDSK
jgi:Fic family protein